MFDINSTHYKRINATKELNDIYHSMKTRCYTKTSKDYKYYGAKGVTICPEWLKSKQSFFRWATQNNYIKGKHLDKDILCEQLDISPKIYSPTTCLWVTPEENNKQRHKG